MSEQEGRLIRCFGSVFPSLTPDEIRTSNTESVAEWDSLAAVTLLAVIQQEFDVAIDPLDLPELNSFEALRNHLGLSRDADSSRSISTNL